MGRSQAAFWAAALAAVAFAALPGAPGSVDGSAGRESPGREAARLVVGLERPVDLAETHLHGHRVADAIPALDVLVLRVPDAAAARADLANRPEVRYVEEDREAFALAMPDDPRYGSQYGPKLMGFPAAWDRGYGAPTVKVAVIDSGIDRTHPDLQASRVLAGYDVKHHDGVPEDDCGHGTAVAGVVAATTGNGVGIAGLAQASLLPLKVMSRSATGACSGSMADVAKAITLATDQGARVIVLSLASSSSDSTTAAALRYAADRGVLVLAGAGNDGRGVKYPASDPNAQAVGAMDAAKAVPSYSSRGPQLDFVAPGSSIVSLRPGSSYASGTGTSYAAPHAAGALALALACAPQADAATLLSHLRASAEDLGAPGRDDVSGHGLVRADRLVAAACGPAPSPVPAPAPPPPTASDWATFKVASGANEWWVEVAVTSSRAVTKVEASIDGGPWTGLPKQDWGNWAKSFFVKAGTPIQFRAHDGTGATILSPSMGWLGGTTAPPPSTSAAFSAAFTAKGIGNAWWVEAAVSASQPVARLTATVGTVLHDLPRTDWGTWAKSIHAPAGTPVRFTAHAADGATATSPTYTW